MRRLAVGKTRCAISHELCGRYGRARVFVKDESRNQSGTVKARRCAALLEAHASKEKVLFVHITSGNSGYSLAKLAADWQEETGKERTVVNIVSKKLATPIKRRLRKCSIVREMNLDKEQIGEDELIDIAKTAAAFDGPDSDIVVVESSGLGNGYEEIIREIHAEGIKPRHIFVPVGGGELAVDLARGVEEVWSKEEQLADGREAWGFEYGSTAPGFGLEEAIWGDYYPKIIGVTIPGNPIVQKKAFVRKPKESIADKLVTAYSKFKAIIESLVKERKMIMITVNEFEIAKEYEHVSELMALEPSAAVAFAGAKRCNLNPDEPIVIVNTGQGIYDRHAVRKMWRRFIWKSARWAAVAFIATVAILGIRTYDLSIKRDRLMLEAENHTLSISAKMHANDAELFRLQKLRAQVMEIADGNGNGRLNEDEIARICGKIPGRRAGRCRTGNAEGRLHLDDFTEAELNFYVRLANQERTGMGQFSIMWADDMRREFRASPDSFGRPVLLRRIAEGIYDKRRSVASAAREVNAR
ncbi:MAG: PLP-dependent lyase/thiolase [Candidatus Micrarchaeota archaeon]